MIGFRLHCRAVTPDQPNNERLNQAETATVFPEHKRNSVYVRLWPPFQFLLSDTNVTVVCGVSNDIILLIFALV